MRLMLDAHTLIWAVDDPVKLGSQAATALQTPGNDLLLSAGTIWEMAIKGARQAGFVHAIQTVDGPSNKRPRSQHTAYHGGIC